MGREEVQEPYVMDDEDRVSIWLRNAGIHQYEEGAGELGDTGTIDPFTPSRRVPLPFYHEEASPTNTDFSNGSVFDAPQPPGGGWIEDVFRDDIPDKDPEDEENKSLARPVQSYRDTDYFEAESYTSNDPPTEAADDADEVADVQGRTPRTAEPLLGPNIPRPTWLTSCTQCIHANLPCSRRAPACSRCRRKGQAALCLLHRRPYPEEILKSNTAWSTTLILLKLKEEDKGTWKVKLKLANELQDSWRVGNDHKNWTLPPVESRRGGFQSNRTQDEKVYPGEGRGERKDTSSYQELCVVIDD